MARVRECISDAAADWSVEIATLDIHSSDYPSRLVELTYYERQASAALTEFERGMYVTRSPFSDHPDLPVDYDSKTFLAGGRVDGKSVEVFVPIDLREHEDVRRARDAFLGLRSRAFDEWVEDFNRQPIDVRKALVRAHRSAGREQGRINRDASLTRAQRNELLVPVRRARFKYAVVVDPRTFTVSRHDR